jgi:hypothetical protein
MKYNSPYGANPKIFLDYIVNINRQPMSHAIRYNNLWRGRDFLDTWHSWGLSP